MNGWGESQTSVTKDFLEVDRDERFIAYAAGFATILRIRLHNHEGIQASELAWLKVNTGLDDPNEACKKLIDAYQLQCVTERITS